VETVITLVLITVLLWGWLVWWAERNLVPRNRGWLFHFSVTGWPDIRPLETIRFTLAL
jgi:hypothetical protein